MNMEQNETVLGDGKPSLLRMIWSPSEQFRKIRVNPIFWSALIITTLIGVVSILFTLGAIDYSSSTIDGYALSAKEEDDARAIGMITGIVVGLFSIAIGGLFSAFIYWIIAKIAKADVGFKQLFSMSVYISFIGVIGAFLNGFVVWLLDLDYIYPLTSVAGLLGKDSAFLGTFELFSIWSTILAGIGLHIVGKFSKGLAWSVTIGIFLIGLLMALGTDALNTMMDTL
ncbi:MAG: Yip1 family protein [Bacillus sp. (in: firmicutes)]